MKSVKIYLATRNSDQTEGRGSMVSIGYFLDDPDAAVAKVKGQGVMGVGDGEVEVITFNVKDGKYLPGVKEMFYGGHQNWRRQWVYGYMDDVNPPREEAEEYQRYLALRKRFEGR